MKRTPFPLLLLIFFLSGTVLFFLRPSFFPPPAAGIPGSGPCPDCYAVLAQADQFTLRKGKLKIYEGYASNPKTKERELRGFVFHSIDIVPQESGYAGPINLLISVDKNGVIQDIRCVSHSETSSYIEPFDRFLKQFLAKGPQNSFKRGEDIDGITGATITSDAVTRIVRESLLRVMAEIQMDASPLRDKVSAAALSADAARIKTKIDRAGLKPQEARYWKIISHEKGQTR